MKISNFTSRILKKLVFGEYFIQVSIVLNSVKIWEERNNWRIFILSRIIFKSRNIRVNVLVKDLLN